MRYYYTPYIQHMMRYYQRTGGEAPAEFRSEADRLNWEAVHAVVSKLMPATVARVFAICCAREPKPLNERIHAYCAEHPRVSEDSVWKAIAEVEALIAKQRGLI